MNKLKNLDKFVYILIAISLFLAAVIAFTSMRLFALWQSSLALGLNNEENVIELNIDNLDNANEYINKDKSVALDLGE